MEVRIEPASVRPILKFRHCPHCGRLAEPQHEAPSFHCPACDFLYYFNPAVSVAALTFREDGKALFIRRARQPAKGMLAIPGGFVDVDETAEAALKREFLEEVNLDIANLKFHCSETNNYPFCGVTYPVLDLYFTASATNPKEASAQDEVESIHWLDPRVVDLDEIAFPAMRRALERYIGQG